MHHHVLHVHEPLAERVVLRRGDDPFRLATAEVDPHVSLKIGAETERLGP